MEEVKDTKTAENTQETVDTSAQTTATEETTTVASTTDTSAEKKDETKEEATVPSWRLREESEKRRQLEERLAKLEGQAKDTKPTNPADIRATLKKNLKPVLNQETGEYEWSDEGINTLTWLITNGVQHITAPMTNKMVASEIKAQKAELKDKPYFKDLESEIDKALSGLSPQQRMQDGVVEGVYKYLRGEKFEELAKKETAKSQQKSQVVGDITSHKTIASSSAKGTPKLTPAQLEEFNRDWTRKGFDEADYLEVLGKIKTQDEAKGYKTQRETMGQSIRS